ncbi:MAG: methylated-DNA--[protein]-cysteine S-methyltransferase [Gammaproteobacteria bacterium]
MDKAKVNLAIGKLEIICNDTQLTNIYFLSSASRVLAPQSTLTKKVCRQLACYFKDPNYQFDLPLNLIGTPLQKKVWKFLTQIASGVTMTYGEAAARLGTHARAIGQACRANPVPIIIPCHRIVAVNGMGGYCGSTRGQQLFLKQYLIAHEQRQVKAQSYFSNKIS